MSDRAIGGFRAVEHDEAAAIRSSLLREIGRFAAVGGLGYVTDVVAFNALRGGAGTPPLMAKAVSVTVATSVAFVGNRYWTYRERTTADVDGDAGVRRQYVAFFGCNLAGLIVQMLCLGVSHYVLGFTSLLMDNLAGNIVGMAFATAFRFWAYRTWVFPPVDPLGDAARADRAADTFPAPREHAREHVRAGAPTP